MPFPEDLLPFFNTSELATLGLYTPGVGQPVQVPGIFENADIEVQVGIAGIEANAPRFVCRVVDIPNPKNGETLQVPYPGGLIYTVQSKQQDGTLVQTVILKEP